jgi:hypothetical protein
MGIAGKCGAKQLFDRFAKRWNNACHADWQWRFRIEPCGTQSFRNLLWKESASLLGRGNAEAVAAVLGIFTQEESAGNAAIANIKGEEHRRL